MSRFLGSCQAVKIPGFCRAMTCCETELKRVKRWGHLLWHGTGRSWGACNGLLWGLCQVEGSIAPGHRAQPNCNSQKCWCQHSSQWPLEQGTKPAVFRCHKDALGSVQDRKLETQVDWTTRIKSLALWVIEVKPPAFLTSSSIAYLTCISRASKRLLLLSLGLSSRFFTHSTSMKIYAQSKLVYHTVK